MAGDIKLVQLSVILINNTTKQNSRHWRNKN